MRRLVSTLADTVRQDVRYGIQLLPSIAVMSATLVAVACEFWHGRWGRVIAGGLAAIIVVASYGEVWKKSPVCLREAIVNSRSRLALERELAKNLKLLPSNAKYLMYLGHHVGVMQDSGIELRRVIHEGNHRSWLQPSDPQGLWERTLMNPGNEVEYVVMFDGDPVDNRVNREGLRLKWVVQSAGQATARIWETKKVPDSKVSR